VGAKDHLPLSNGKVKRRDATSYSDKHVQCLNDGIPA